MWESKSVLEETKNGSLREEVFGQADFNPPLHGRCDFWKWDNHREPLALSYAQSLHQRRFLQSTILAA